MDDSQTLEAPAQAAPFVENLPTIAYDVVRHRGSWRVLHIGKHSSPHANQKSAIDWAMKAAAQDLASGRIVAVRLNRTDGQIFDLACPIPAS